MIDLNFDGHGLIPAVVQDINDGTVLMVAWMNRVSLERTLRDRLACFWSRSRQELWVKGDTSGNFLRVIEIRVDCDADTLLIMVQPLGPACHTGERTCFFRNIDGDRLPRVEKLEVWKKAQ